MWAFSFELGSSAFQIFTKKQKKIEEEGALPSLQKGIAKYHNKNKSMFTLVSNTIFGIYIWDQGSIL